jgi:hypothetical protein
MHGLERQLAPVFIDSRRDMCLAPVIRPEGPR